MQRRQVPAQQAGPAETTPYYLSRSSRMFFLRKPTPDDLRRYLEANTASEFSYAAIGGTASKPPGGFTVDHMRIQLGSGEPTFNAAKLALQRWEHFRLGWLEAWPTDTPI